MNSKYVLRWLGIVVAIPAGGFFGFICAYEVCLGILYLQGKGNSHDDMFTVVAAGMLGSVLGALLVPLCTWFLTRQREK
jgi:hypothetical protein